MDVLRLVGRTDGLFDEDIHSRERVLTDMIARSRVLVVGAAGSIGQAVCLELFRRSPKMLHAVDISENNMVELVRSIRSSLGYNSCDFRTFAIDCGSKEFEHLAKAEGPYDYVFNLSALKHVRSEKDKYTLMRLINTNIFNSIKVLQATKSSSLKKYFCVSTDKAANPVNMMGASKRIMEYFMMRESMEQSISMARFANVAFSDGSLLHGFNQRFLKQQPLSAPNDIERYFISPKESGELCLLSSFFGENRDVFFPKLQKGLKLEKFSEIAFRYLKNYGFMPHVCESEDEARENIIELIAANKWPIYLFNSQTTGEKPFEEFYTSNENIDLDRFENLGVISNDLFFDSSKLTVFEQTVSRMCLTGSWEKGDLVDLFKDTIPEFSHFETGNSLDNRM